MRRRLPLWLLPLPLFLMACAAGRTALPIDANGIGQEFLFYTGTAVSSGGNASAPSAVTDGVDVTSSSAFRVLVSAASGQTLSGAGTLRIWLYSKSLARWCYNPQLDWAASFSSGTWRDVATPDFSVAMGFSRVYAQLIGFTSSSGNVTPTVEVGVRR